MADKVNIHTFHNTLRNVSIDVSEFLDPTFDGICSENELQPFLKWMCNNLDGDNVLPPDEIDNYHKHLVEMKIEVSPKKITSIPEELKVGCDDAYAEKSLERRLQKSEANHSTVRYLAKRMNEKEKETIVLSNKVRDDLVKKVSQCLTDDIIVACNETLVTCSLVDPIVPGFDDYSNIKDEVYRDLESLHKSYIDFFEELEEKERTSLLPKIEDLEEQLVDAVFRRKTSERALQTYASTFDETVIIREPPSLDSIIRDVSIEVKRRKIDILSRELGAYTYLLSTLESYRILALRYLSNNLAFNGALQERHDYLVHLHKLTSDFTAKISLEIKNLECCIAVLSEDSNVCNGNDDVGDSKGLCNGGKPNVDVRKPSAVCELLLEPSQQEQVLCQHLYRQIGRLLTELRSGPTRQFNLLPTSLLAKLGGCRKSRNNLNNELKHLIHCYVNLNESLTKGRDWPKKLLWVFFLLRPTKLLSILDNPLSSLSNSRVCQSMFNISFASSADSTRN